MEGDDYFEAITLAATVFTLTQAFRVARLVTRTNNEEARIYSLFRKMEALVRHNVINTGVVESILKLNNPGVRQTESRKIYSEIRTHTANSYKGPENISGSDQEMLTQAENARHIKPEGEQPWPEHAAITVRESPGTAGPTGRP